ncbi:N-acetylglucosamine-6-phosphate deacetylase [Sphingobacterium sp. lm-10]|uniref:N-acetylglucosamine-6-phosphate deacetylase n=1 Tax=Sphingobacterium sp. lm-10 TaxID=2944904 RepID=UPI00202075E4|nr:N-acetylglucosamine-6-phosphate deacetylase [Sphingobacterium sp. lm-10]MCL7986720.1 N-acetylglucosamine-6-phosphate deacetylase [Sphingobacterium sp. lm-10]
MKLFATTMYTGTTVLKNQLINTQDGKIVSITSGEADADCHSVDCIAPGFVDIHINGGRQFHFTQKPDLETIEDISTSSALLGTAYTLPTLITSPLENMMKGVEAIKNYSQSSVLGMHVEGPYISPEKRGAHLLRYIRKPSDADIEQIVLCSDAIRLLTIAPELFSKSQLRTLIESGIPIAAGHSNANYLVAKQAFDQGIKLVTHLYNAMSPFTHREPGLVGAVLDSPHVYAPIILDGLHCDYAAARIAWATKGDKLFLISDALFVDRKVKSFQWNGFDSALKNNAYYNSEGNLSGAAISLGDAVRNAVAYVGIPVQDAIEMASIRPAIAVGMEDRIGKIEPGYPARFTTFDRDLNVFKVIS